MNVTGYLIIRNGSEVRWAKRTPSLEPNEVAVRVKISAPSPPRIVAALNIELPEPPPAYASAEVIEYTEQGATE